MQARFPRGKVKIDGASTTYTRLADSGNAIPFHFCPTCGSTVYYELAIDDERFVAVPVGAFADRNFPEPRVSVYEARQYPWAQLATQEAIEHFD